MWSSTPPKHPRILHLPKLIFVNLVLLECIALSSCALFPAHFPAQKVEFAYAAPLPNAPVLLTPPPAVSTQQQPAPGSRPTKLTRNLPPLDFPDNAGKLPEILADDLDENSLAQAVENYLEVLRGQDLRQTVTLGPLTMTLDRLKLTLEEFLGLLNQKLSHAEFTQKLKQTFIFYPAGKEKNRQIVFTGYYTPIVSASRFKWEGYNYPLYEMPRNLTKIKYVYRQRLPDGTYAVSYLGKDGPNFTREDIDGRRILQNENLEIAWLQNDLERYFLHIQGSGILEYLDGTREGVRYSGSNGYSYRPIGKLMLQDGVLLPSQGSMQGIKKYFEEHPGDTEKYLFRNRRYIFFELTNGKPRGSSGAEVVAGRSIATDPVFYPPGALAFIMAKKPVLGDDNEITKWKKFSRFVVNQDTGNAIKGPRRVDLYFGAGDRAGAAAGRYMETGKMFFLIKK